jgi:hypothetical protein
MMTESGSITLRNVSIFQGLDSNLMVGIVGMRRKMTSLIPTPADHYRGYCDMICRGCGLPADFIRCKECWDKLYEETAKPFTNPSREEKEESPEETPGEGSGSEALQ